MADWVSLDEIVHSHAPKDERSYWLAGFLRSCKESETQVCVEIAANSPPPYLSLYYKIYEEEPLADYWARMGHPDPSSEEGRTLSKAMGYAINPSPEERDQGIKDFSTAKIPTEEVIGEETEELPAPQYFESIFPQDLILLARRVEEGKSYQESLIGLRIVSPFEIKIQTTSTTLYVWSESADELLSHTNLKLQRLYKRMIAVGEIEPLSNSSDGHRWKFLKPNNYLYALVDLMHQENFIQNKDAHITKFLNRKGKPIKKCRSLDKEDPTFDNHREYARQWVRPD